MFFTENFNPLRDKMLNCQCGYLDCTRPAVNQYTLNKLQKMRNDLGRPIMITSGARCPLHKLERGRVNTDHQSGYAVDIFCADHLERVKLLVLAGRHNAQRVAVGANFIHLCFKPDDTRRDVPTWDYHA